MTARVTAMMSDGSRLQHAWTLHSGRLRLRDLQLGSGSCTLEQMDRAARA